MTWHQWRRLHPDRENNGSRRVPVQKPRQTMVANRWSRSLALATKGKWQREKWRKSATSKLESELLRSSPCHEPLDQRINRDGAWAKGEHQESRKQEREWGRAHEFVGIAEMPVNVRNRRSRRPIIVKVPGSPPNAVDRMLRVDYKAFGRTGKVGAKTGIGILGCQNSAVLSMFNSCLACKEELPRRTHARPVASACRYSQPPQSS
jgi:hypothetical protein